MKRPLSKSQSVCIVLLWGLLCFLMLTTAKSIDGMTLTSLFIGTALLFIPVYKSYRQLK